MYIHLLRRRRYRPSVEKMLRISYTLFRSRSFSIARQCSGRGWGLDGYREICQRRASNPPFSHIRGSSLPYLTTAIGSCAFTQPSLHFISSHLSLWHVRGILHLISVFSLAGCSVSISSQSDQVLIKNLWFNLFEIKKGHPVYNLFAVYDVLDRKVWIIKARERGLAD